MLIRLRVCAGWSASLLFAYGINRFSHEVAHMYLQQLGCIMWSLLIRYNQNHHFVNAVIQLVNTALSNMTSVVSCFWDLTKFTLETLLVCVFDLNYFALRFYSVYLWQIFWDSTSICLECLRLHNIFLLRTGSQCLVLRLHSVFFLGSIRFCFWALNVYC